jgi:hypothetical protein
VARALVGEPFETLLKAPALIASLIVPCAAFQFVRDEVANATAALMKARVRAGLGTRRFSATLP